MTVFVVESRKNGKGMNKPQPLPQRYQEGDNLNWLVAQHPDAIYFTDDVEAFMGPITVTEDRLKMMLASRIMVASKAVDNLREHGKVTTTMGTIENGVHVAENIAVIQELERMWESLFDTPPNMGDTMTWATRANQSSEV